MPGRKMLTFSLAFRVEWAKCKARALCWHEELLLLEEEMCCVLAYLPGRVPDGRIG